MRARATNTLAAWPATTYCISLSLLALTGCRATSDDLDSQPTISIEYRCELPPEKTPVFWKELADRKRNYEFGYLINSQELGLANGQYSFDGGIVSISQWGHEVNIQLFQKRFDDAGNDRSQMMRAFEKLIEDTELTRQRFNCHAVSTVTSQK